MADLSDEAEIRRMLTAAAMQAPNMTIDKYHGFSSGVPSLDNTLRGVWAGDNIVLQVDDIQDFLPFVHRFCRYTDEAGEKLVYFRFADHPSFLPEGVQAECHHLNPQAGFEQFIFEIFTVIERNGKGVYYLFDCLSGLAVDWYSDRMLGNFFMLTCPYLYIYDTVTYFVLLRNLHTPLAINAIHNTAQVVTDVFSSHGKLYLLPLKVFERYSPTLYMLHHWDEDDVFRPVTKSTVLSEILANTPQPWLDVNVDRKDPWTEAFIQAQVMYESLQTGQAAADEVQALKRQLMKMVLTRDEHLFRLCDHYFELADLVAIGKRMIGTGLVGGKSVGMLLARRILSRESARLRDLLETHDSFFIGSDLFYSYLIENDCWWERHHMKTADNVYERARQIQDKLRTGRFPVGIMDQFKEMLSYFGQSPIIVRSSSLLEDAYGNAFSGKYESVFCANQGDPDQRLQNFIEAVRTVYASTLSEEALSYRIHRGLLQQDEQMALLVQRVSGEFYEHLYLPQAGGVGYSFNPFVWNKKIDPAQGMLRLVFGLGTRAVDRHDDDYTRVVALNEPLLRPEGSSDEVRKYSQKIINVLDLQENQHVSRDFETVAQTASTLPLAIFASRDTELEARARQLRMKNVFSYVLNFKTLLTKTAFVPDIKEMLATLHRAYHHPVDIEFTVNFLEDDDYRINLLQCRPFQFTGEVTHLQLPENIRPEEIILQTNGPLIGQSMARRVARIIYIVPEGYGHLPTSERYTVARLIGQITMQQNPQQTLMLIGPGRWGTRMPELGIPVSFSEIKNVAVLCEIARMHEGLNPDLSLGTHFFNDLVDMNILYMGIAPEHQESVLHEHLLRQAPNRLAQFVDDSDAYREMIYVIDTADICPGCCVRLHADSFEQTGLVFLASDAG